MRSSLSQKATTPVSRAVYFPSNQMHVFLDFLAFFTPGLSFAAKSASEKGG